MNPWDQFKRTLVGKQINLVRREYDWVFAFGDGLWLGISTLWRLRDPDGVVKFTSNDDGQQFGLPTPLDVEIAANKSLVSATVVSLEDADIMPDFEIRFSNGFTIDVIANSGGYESWQTTFEEVTIIGRCGD